MNFEIFLRNLGSWFISSGITILLIVVISTILVKSAQVFSGRVFQAVQKSRVKSDEEFRKRMDTLGSIVRYILTIGILVVAVVMIMDKLGIEIGPILAAAGVLGLAVGFGAQSLVRDIIGGFFIFLEDQIRVGDVVDIAGKSGIVERVNLRMTIIRDLAGNVHFIPNGEIHVVTNMTKVYSRYVFDIGVAYREDVDEVMAVMKEVDEELRGDEHFGQDIIEPLEILGVDQFADSAVIIKARTTTRPIKQWRVAREFNRRLKKKFDEKGIEIPFPHVTLYMGKDKQDQAPPLEVRLDWVKDK